MSPRPVVALAGGVGAARFLIGLVEVIPATDLTVIVNTGDDREFFGLRVCPDLDIITYTLAGCVRPDTGWGIAGDSLHCLEALRHLRRDTWFQLGDRDLATHIHRSERLRRGVSLTEVTQEITRAFGLEVQLLPMCESPAPTRILRSGGAVSDFEEYLVRDGAPDDVEAVDLSAAAGAEPAPGVLESLEGAQTVLICPSNPVVSIGTIRSVPGVDEQLSRDRRAIAVSPIIGGKPVKGPADRLLRAVGAEVSALGVAHIYREIAAGMVIDRIDAHLAPDIEALGLAVRTTDTLMRNKNVSRELAVEALQLAKALT
jgi:LPPG:FO 2-phospho-L-lactate transferase